MPRPELPRGTVTFLFTDVEDSTKLLHELGAEAYARALTEHRQLLRDAFRQHGGVEVDTQGDAFFIAFPTAPGAVAAALGGRNALASGPIRVRMGLHTGTPYLGDEGYVGSDVHLGARIAAGGHGGQILLSNATRELVADQLEDLGEHRIKDFADPVWIFQLGFERFPPLRTISNTNLPRPPSSFIGRERERAEVSSMLRDGARLVTLTRPGGAGNASGDRGRGRARARLQERRVLGRARDAARSGPRHGDGRPDPRRQGRPRGSHRGTRDASSARQLRASRRRRRGCLQAALGLPQPARARHQPRATADRGRARIPGTAAGRP